jgi:hypothetical protein
MASARGLELGRLALDHHHGQSVQEEHDVGHDMMFRPQHAHLELAHGNEAVVVAAVEIDKAHRGAPRARPAVFGHAGILQQQVQDMAVVLDQTAAGEIGRKLLDHRLHLVLFQPRIDRLQLLAQHGRHVHFGEVRAEGGGGMLLGVEVEDFPAEPGKLVQQRLFDVVAFVELELG